MAGTKAGGYKAATTDKQKYGAEFYRAIGRIGGHRGHSGGFAANPELAKIAGSIGGKRSKRGKAIYESAEQREHLEKIRQDEIEEEIEKTYKKIRNGWRGEESKDWNDYEAQK